MNLIEKLADYIAVISLELKKEKKEVISAVEKDISLSTDKYLNDKVIKFLNEHSSFPILSEESSNEIKYSDFEDKFWIIDPLDGTLNYSREIPLSCISIALWSKKGPISGLIYDFVRGEMFIGNCEENCAVLNNKRISCSNNSSKSNSIIATGFPSWRNFEDDSLMKFVEKVKDWKKVRLLGTAALSLAWLAAGRLDAYIEEDIRIWDVAAGMAIIKASGGSIYIKENNRTNFITAIATNGKLDIGGLK